MEFNEVREFSVKITNLPKLLNFTTVGKFADTAKKPIANG